MANEKRTVSRKSLGEVVEGDVAAKEERRGSRKSLREVKNGVFSD